MWSQGQLWLLLHCGSASQGQAVSSLSAATLQTRAKTVRNDLFKHMSKHQDEYQEWFQPDPDAGQHTEARDGRWVDGLSLLAASRRYGIRGDSPDGWRPGTDACLFWPTTCSERPHGARLERRALYARKAQRRASVATHWLQAEQASVSHAMFRGGGNHKVPSWSPGGSSWRPSATPKSALTEWRPDATPKSVKGKGIATSSDGTDRGWPNAKIGQK